VAFFDPYSSEVQQRLRIELLAEALERLERLGVGDLGVDVHCDVDLRMPQESSSVAAGRGDESPDPADGRAGTA